MNGTNRAVTWLPIERKPFPLQMISSASFQTHPRNPIPILPHHVVIMISSTVPRLHSWVLRHRIMCQHRDATSKIIHQIKGLQTRKHSNSTPSSRNTCYPKPNTSDHTRCFCAPPYTHPPLHPDLRCTKTDRFLFLPYRVFSPFLIACQDFGIRSY